MSSKRILGIAGAAMVGTLAGTGMVYATISIGDSGTTGAPTFATETLRSDRNIPPGDGDGGPFYEAAAHTGNSGELDVNVPIGIVVPASTANGAVVTVDLTNLVLTGAPVVALNVTDAGGTDVSNVTTSVISGGGRGDRQVRLQITTGATAIDADGRLVIELGRIGVDPKNPGSITVTTAREVAGVDIDNVVNLPDAVKTASALKVTATPQTQTAAVDEGFMKFKSGTGVSEDQLAAQVGNLEIGIATTTETFYNAGRGDVASGEVTAASHLLSDAAIVFSGPTSFLAEDDDENKLVYVGDVDCTPAASSIADDDGELKASLDDFDDTGGGYLCLKVDGDTAIPTTTGYTAAITYTSILGANAVFPPAGSSHTLGSIGRDGTSVRIAHLNTNARVNQRLVLVNRSGAPAEYSMTFETAEGVTYTEGEAANGTLPEGRTVLLVSDIVTFNGGSSGAAELSIVAASSMIDAATVTTTRANGSTDTVVLTPQ